MTKPIASLSSGLLARKGEARPAMRSQSGGAGGIDDLGWNDMGDNGLGDLSPVMAPVPAVLAERRALERRMLSPAAAERVARESLAQTVAGKTAFTLRLDGDRHLRLRLASAISNASAQTLVTQALDAFLQNYPQMDALMAQLCVGEG